MPTWVRTLVVLTVLGVWVIVVGVGVYGYLFRGGPLPDVALLGVPAMVVLAVAPIPGWAKRIRGESAPTGDGERVQ